MDRAPDRVGRENEVWSEAVRLLQQKSCICGGASRVTGARFQPGTAAGRVTEASGERCYALSKTVAWVAGPGGCTSGWARVARVGSLLLGQLGTRMWIARACRRLRPASEREAGDPFLCCNARGGGKFRLPRRSA